MSVNEAVASFAVKLWTIPPTSAQIAKIRGVSDSTVKESVPA